MLDREGMVTFSRRDFLCAAGSGLLLAPWSSPVRAVAAGERSYSLKPQPVGKAFSLAGGKNTECWAFDGSSPGPELRFKKGERALISVSNGLKRNTTVHWHGVRVPNAMDGVPYVSQEPIAPGESFTYDFRLPDSGTFWYHPHERSYEQVGRGLFGPLIVEEEEPLPVDRDLTWVLADFLIDPASGEHRPFGEMSAHARSGRLGNVITVNGRESGKDSRLEVAPGERIRLRLINAATARVFALEFAEHQPWVIAFDGNGIPPRPLTPENTFLGPGMRIDLVIDCSRGAGGRYAVKDLVSNQAIASLEYRDVAPVRSERLPPPKPLAPNAYPVPDIKRATHHSIEFRGGDQGPPTIGRIDGKDIPYEDMKSKYGVAWTVAGHSASEDSHHHEPLLVLKRNRSYVLTLSNSTGYIHPMHLHGTTFRVLSYNGANVPYPEWRDTVYLDPFEEVRIAFVADNPGDWMFHCHILEHAASGMMGVFRIE